MALTPEAPPERLPCGRDPLDVWDHAAARRLDYHEQSCPYCQGVAGEQAVVSGPADRYLSTVGEPPTSLLDRVMTAVRAGLRARDVLPLPSPHGPVTVDAATAAAALRYTVDQGTTARARSCRIRPRHVPPAGDHQLGGDPVLPPSVTISLSIAVLAGEDIEHLAGHIRDLVIRVCAEVLGLDVATVDIDVVDLLERP